MVSKDAAAVEGHGGPQTGELLRSGSGGRNSASVRAGFLPLALEHLVLESLAEIAVYIRVIGKDDGVARFTLYCTPQVRFAERHRQRLQSAGIKFVYIPLAQQMTFRRQSQALLVRMAGDRLMAITTKSQLVYETSVEVMNEVLAEQCLGETLPQVETLAHAVTTLVMQNRNAFAHLFAASQHDFYTATHMVNVGTWMVPLAWELGIQDEEALGQVCQAGMLHDVGKIFVPEEVLNKRGRLTAEDWAQLREHPARGAEHLAKCANISEAVRNVARGHHERMDGTGYPGNLAGEQIDLWSRICAVVDSFDAMTAFRPFRKEALSFGAAMRILQKEAGVKYDAKVVEAWVALMEQADRAGVLPAPLEEEEKPRLGRRAHERFTIECAARVHMMDARGVEWEEGEGINATVHSLSRAGLGFLSQSPVEMSGYARVYLLGVGTLANRVLEGQVVRCRAYGDGWHDVGMYFAALAKEREAATAEVGAAV